MRESAVEARLTRHVKRLGGISIKLAPTQAGVPDRLILLPNGRSLLIEVKADGGRLSAIQRVWHERAAAIGHPVTVLTGSTEVDNWKLQYDEPHG